MTESDPKLTPITPWENGEVQLSTVEARRALLFADHPESASSYKTDTAILHLLDLGQCVVARGRGYKLIIKASMAAESEDKVAIDILSTRDPKELASKRADIERQIEQLDSRRSELRETIAEAEQRLAADEAELHELEGGEHGEGQEAQEATLRTETDGGAD